MQRLAIALFGLGMLALAPTAAAKERPQVALAVNGDIEIGPDGLVRSYVIGSKVSDEVAKLVERHVRGWRFEPILVDGKPVVAKTAMHLELTGDPVGDADDYKVTIANLWFGEPKMHGTMKPPHYPRIAVAGHVEARVLLSLRLDDTGSVADVDVYQTSLGVRTRSEHEAQSWRREFERASVAAARDWHFDLSQTVNGKPMGGNVMVPVSYFLCQMPCRKDGNDGRWRAYIPGPVHPAPWSGATIAAAGAGAASLRDGEALPLDSRFRLKDDVVGKVL